MVYFRATDAVADHYYSFWRENGREVRFFPFIDDETQHYLSRYVLPRTLHGHLQPFCFVDAGSNAIHVGFHDQYIWSGISHPLIAAGLVTDSGHVWAIDPDQNNTAAMKRYVAANGMTNLSVIESGVWSEPGTLDCLMFEDFTSSNTLVNVFHRFKEGAEKRWGRERIEQHSSTRAVAVRTLDDIVEKDVGLDRAIDFVNLTVNGAEPDVVAGARETISRNPGIKIAMPASHLSPSLEGYFESEGFLLAVADAPHRPWEREQFYYVCAIRTKPQDLLDRGFRPAKMQQVTARSEDAVGRFRIEEV